jgi:CBS domain-containing protein
MYVQDVMTRGVVCVAPTCSLKAAREQLAKHRIHHLLVLENDRLVGVLSYHHLMTGSDYLTAADVMSRDVVMLTPTDTLRSAASLMLGRSHGCAAVLNGDTVSGVVTTTDLLHAITSGC